MYRLIMIVTALTFFGMAPEDIPGSKLLVKLDLVTPTDLTKLEALKIPVYENFGRYILTCTDRSGLEFFKANNFPCQILDAEPVMPGEYYSVFAPKGLDCAQLSHYGRVLLQEGNRAIIKTTQARAWRIPSLGYEIKKLRTRPVVNKATSAGNEPSFSYTADTSYIQQMVNQVTVDSVQGLIQKLQDFGTRYSSTPGCSLAAEYMKQRFEAANLNAQFHSYEVLLTPIIYDVSAVSGQEAWAVDENGEIWRTTDGGGTWMNKYVQPENIPLLGVEFKSSLLGWACGGDGIIVKTTNGGTSWNEQTRGLSYRFWDVQFINENQGWATGDSGRIARTSNGGTNWTAQNVGQTVDLYGLSFINANNGWVAANSSTQGIILKTSNGGTNWAVQYEDTLAILYGVKFVDANNGWVVGMNSRTGAAIILKTTDGGTSWNKQTVPGWALIDVDFVNATTGWACGWANILHTTNGNTWTTQSHGVYELFFTIDFVNADSGWVVGEGGSALETHNGGTNWKPDTVTADTVKWRNVVATMPGEVHPESTFIICGHYDNTSEMPIDSAPGADDNASGTTVALAAASILSQYRFEKTVKFIAFSGEEQGLLGSAAYAQEVQDTMSIGGVLNFDMVSFCEAKTYNLDIITDNTADKLPGFLVDSLAPRYTTLEAHKVVDPSATYSDHSSFWDIGVSAICAIETNYDQNPNYHTTDDLVSTLNIPFAAENVKLGVAGIAYLAGPIGPRGIESEKPAARDLRFELSAAPNPFSRTVKISSQYSGASSEGNTLKIYDLTGKLVKSFYLTNHQLPITIVSWDGSDDQGNALPGGVYFCCLGTNERIATEKIVLTR